MIAPSIHRDREKLNLMNSIQCRRAVAVLVVCFLWLFGGESFLQTANAQQVSDGPKFKVDPLWPQPLPDRWVTGSVGGTCVDAKDHVFTVNRGDLSPKEKKNATQAPPIIEYDQAGQMVNAWGNYETFPARPHGCFVDYEGNVWIGGNEDAIVQKYTHDGSKLLLQIGTKGLFDTSDGTMAGAPMNSSHTLLNLPSSIAVDPANGDVYITDGYGNRRVVVFDHDGKFLRQWGVQGTVAQTDEGAPGVFLKVVHCVVIANDGLLYVCDRLGGRIEVFDKLGNFKRNIVIPSKTARSTGVGAACWVDFSPDKEQKYMYVADCGDEEVRVMDHATGKTLSSFGRPGHQAGQFENLHSLSVDSKGDIIIGETLGGHRAQMFRPITQ